MFKPNLQDELLPGEKPVFLGEISWMDQWFWFINAAGVLANLAIPAMMPSSPAPSGADPLSGLVGSSIISLTTSSAFMAVNVGMGALCLLWGLLAHWGKAVLVTDRRCLIKSGVIFRKFIDTPLANIAHIEPANSLPGRFLNYDHPVFHFQDGRKLQLKYLQDTGRLRSSLERARAGQAKK